MNDDEKEQLWGIVRRLERGYDVNQCAQELRAVLAANAQATIEAVPTEHGIYAWVAEGSASLVLVHTRPSAHSPGGVLKASVINSSKFYDGCPVDQWIGGRWFGPLRKDSPPVTNAAQPVQPMLAVGSSPVAAGIMDPLVNGKTPAQPAQDERGAFETPKRPTDGVYSFERCGIKPMPLHPTLGEFDPALAAEEAQRLTREKLTRINYPTRASASPVQTAAARDVLAERERQKTVEGWTPEHDDEHDEGQLSMAACGYASRASDAAQDIRHGLTGGLTYDDVYTGAPGPEFWPHGWEFKAATPRRMLVKAGALILAEIERLDRDVAKGEK